MRDLYGRCLSFIIHLKDATWNGIGSIAKMVMFRRQNPKWDQNPSFVPETTNILSTFAYVRVPSRFSTSYLPFKTASPPIAPCQVSNCLNFDLSTQYLIAECSALNKFLHERFYKQKFPVIMQVSFPESTNVPTHTGLTHTVLNCRNRKTRHWKSQNCRDVWIFDRFKLWLNVLKDQQSRELRIIWTTCPAVYVCDDANKYT